MGPENSYYGTTSIYINPKGHFDSGFNYRTEGFELLDGAREKEIAAGDKWCSPFASPGYTGNEEEHINSAQWLGMLKIYAAMGSEFFYPGNFNLDWSEGRCEDLAYPNEYVYIATTPAYAQGITSRAMKLFREGDLLEGSPMPAHYYPAVLNNWKEFNYNFETEEHNSLVVVRKREESEGLVEYLISGNLNRMSNKDDRNAQEVPVSINLEGEEVHFNLRTQGSNYIFHKKVNQPTKSTFYQLDGWHEGKHPAHWSKEFHLEAELNDNPDDHFQVFTWKPSSVTNQFDYTNYRSFIKLNRNGFTQGTSADPASFKFFPRALDEVQEYEVHISARKKNSVGNVFIEFNNTVFPVPCSISSNNWKEYPGFCNTTNPIIIAPTNLETENEIKVYATDGEVHLDYIRLVPVSGTNREAKVDPLTSLKMDVYPNPSNSKAILKINSSLANTGSIRILNNNGQTVYSREVSIQVGEQQIVLPVSELASGIYYVQLNTGEEVFNQKLEVLH